VRHAQPSFWFVAYAFFVVMLGTTLPSPLYPIYQQRYGFSELLITVIFATYAVCVIGGLVLFGRLSDDIGRRVVLLPGVALSALSAATFLLAAGIIPILAGRVLSGLSAAIFTGTATAALLDLAPQGKRLQATALAVASNLGGLSAGQLVSGLLAQYAPFPLQLPFIVDLALTVPAGLAILLMPETVTRQVRRWRLQRLAVPPEVKRSFIPAAIAGFCGFAVFGVFGSVVPSFLNRALHLPNHAVAGATLFAVLGFSVVGQLAVNRLSERVALPLGCGDLMVGSALLGLAVMTSTLWPLLAATPFLGIGEGLIVGSGLGAINKRAPQARRGEVASTYFIALYVGLSLPVVGVGFLADILGLRTAGVVLAIIAVAVVGGVLAWLVRRPVLAG
jgi:MFS family permease